MILRRWLRVLPEIFGRDDGFGQPRIVASRGEWATPHQIVYRV